MILKAASAFILVISASLSAGGFITTKELPSIRTIADTSQKGLIHVAFDLDGTMVDSTASLNTAYLKATNITATDTTATNTTVFYDYLNGEEGIKTLNYKCKMLEVLKLHLDKGDDIHIFSSRESINFDSILQNIREGIRENLLWQYPMYRELYERVDTHVHGVYFTNHGAATNKTQLIKDHEIDLYYGDADDEKKAAEDNGIVFIRVLRSDSDTMNFIEPKPNIDFKNEYVLEDSHMGVGIKNNSNPMRPICSSPGIPKTHLETYMPSNTPWQISYDAYNRGLFAGSLFGLTSQTVNLISSFCIQPRYHGERWIYPVRTSSVLSWIVFLSLSVFTGHNI